MIKLDSGNVLLKPSHRKQLMAWLKRAVRLGKQVGNFLLTLTLHRAGRTYDVRAVVQDSKGNFDCHSRHHDWRNALRDVVRSLTVRLHEHRLARVSL
jgi:hypothetical protein